MIAITKVKQNLSVLVVREGKTMSQMVSPDNPGFTEVILDSHRRLKALGLIDLVEVSDKLAPAIKKSEGSAPVEVTPQVQVTIKRRRRKSE